MLKEEGRSIFPEDLIIDEMEGSLARRVLGERISIFQVLLDLPRLSPSLSRVSVASISFEIAQ